MNFIYSIFYETWNIFLNSAAYIVFGIFIAGLIRIFLKPETIHKHLGRGPVKSVFKASLLGVPLPLCSCGVIPAAASLKRQGATNGATTAFLISTPESGVDSIAVSYALLDPIMTVIRPIAAFFTAIFAGIAENLLSTNLKQETNVEESCCTKSCCGTDQVSPNERYDHLTFVEKLKAGMRFAFKDIWEDLATWFFIGLFLAGIITASVPSEVMGSYFGGGIDSMLLILLFAVPLYICATASTPIAAALILKGVSPGTALVFLLVGPATNMASLTVLLKLIGKRSLVIYLFSIVFLAILFGLSVDHLYSYLGISITATLGEASEIIPGSVKLISALFLIALSIKTWIDQYRKKNQ